VLTSLLAAGRARRVADTGAHEEGPAGARAARPVPGGPAAALQEVALRETTTLGVRSYAVDPPRAGPGLAHGRGRRPAGAREARPARGEVVNAVPEWDDVAAAAAALGPPGEAGAAGRGRAAGACLVLRDQLREALAQRPRASTRARPWPCRTTPSRSRRPSTARARAGWAAGRGRGSRAARPGRGPAADRSAPSCWADAGR
jgi:hypothetical protein